MKATHCLNCDRLLPKASHHCIYCGTPTVSPQHIIEHGHAHSRNSFLWDDQAFDQSLLEDDYEDAVTEEVDKTAVGQASHATWQKVVETPSRPPATVPPRPPSPPQSLAIFRYLPYVRPISPFWMFWLSLILVLLLFVGGALGVARSFGAFDAQDPVGPTLTVTPHTVVAGATINIRGAGFTPKAQIGLMHNNEIPLVNTNGKVIIAADKAGAFSDTAIVGFDWESGTHTISVQDAQTQKIISVPILVVGGASLVRPPHLKLSVDHLNFGTGDQATNSVHSVELSNTGASHISWQATTNQSWLMITPANGMFTEGQKPIVRVAVNRSNLPPGDYTAEVIFASSAGDHKLPIKMTVLPLPTASSAILQLSPAVLSFTGTNGGAMLAPQVVTVSNPGVKPLEWTAKANEPWVHLDSSEDVIGAADSMPVKVSIDTQKLLPGTHSAKITFTSVGEEALHSPQDIFVSVTIVPACVLQATPGMLSFSATVAQSAPTAKLLQLSTSRNCSQTVHWKASTSVPWIKLDAYQGTSPSSLQVAVNTAGLAAGNYTGSITLDTGSGTQIVVVNLTLERPSVPVLDVVTTALHFSGTAGVPTVPSQVLSITNPGTATLVWKLQTQNTVGAKWLTLSRSSGQLAPKQTERVIISATVLDTMTPATYTDAIIVTGTNVTGKPVSGSPQTVPAKLIVEAACSLNVSKPSLAFAGVSNQQPPAMQSVTLSTSGRCVNPVQWTATTTTKATDGNWLQTNAKSGRIAVNASGSLGVSVNVSGLSSGTYTGLVTLSAVDSISGISVGVPQVIEVSLYVQPACTLQTPSATQIVFDARQGDAPTSFTFTVGVTGVCQGSVLVTPIATVAGGGDWLTVVASSSSVTSGKSITLTVTATTATLPEGSYTGSISLTAVDAGIAIIGSPQVIPVTLDVLGQPTPQSATPTPSSTVPITLTQPIALLWRFLPHHVASLLFPFHLL